jgi:hypothetical protein
MAEHIPATCHLLLCVERTIVMLNLGPFRLSLDHVEGDHVIDLCGIPSAGNMRRS